jgi:hypothetical protein
MEIPLEGGCTGTFTDCCSFGLDVDEFLIAVDGTTLLDLSPAFLIEKDIVFYYINNFLNII